MTHQTQELVTHFADLVLSTHGSHAEFKQISAYESASKSSLVFIQEPQQLLASTVIPAAIITTERTAQELSNEYTGFIICVTNVKLAQALIKQHFDDYQARDDEWPRIHPSANIHKSSEIGANSRIGPNVTIGANCHIANHVIIRANSVIEHDVTIGDHSIINAQTNIGYGSLIGKNTTIQSGVIIGNEGYGFATDPQGQHHRIPHTGNVIIKDDVHIGSNSCIDRGTYDATIIERGVKIDNLCHIAHNVQIGEDSLITAQCVIAGSSVIGKRVMMSGQTGVLDHKTVPDDTVLVHRAGVSESLPKGGMWAGSPAKPFKEFVRNLAINKKVRRLELEVKQLKQLLAKTDANN